MSTNSKMPTAAQWLPPGTFANKICLVTGGGTGLGLEISRGLAALGATVVIASRNPENHAKLQKDAAEHGWTIESEVCDVREPALVRTCVEAIIDRHGRIDHLINNAAGNFVCPSERLSANAWRAVLGIVLDGTFYVSQAVGKTMIAGEGGSILNVVATYAWTGMAGVVHSASAKAGVLAMTKTLASEWSRHGIRVNAIAPGPFESKGAAANLWPNEEVRKNIERAIPLGRFATTDEVAAQCLHLLSPASDYITGECLVIDGGGTLPPPFWEAGTRFKRRRSESKE
ncbi:MAG: NAD(P)-dependent dehydrogenase (short-subunit alcohol dehydrogenase family) [Candidatus Paceibacteria bacterium]|jgi:NAD(P)-dependent dehydrogenase (short-subunit alcohol dehydrogenase family)